MNPVKLIKPRKFSDERGWFSEVYSEKDFLALGINATFVQDNHSYSKPIGTIRGLHFQSQPFGQDKLVRCVRGRIYDAAVDLRRGSPTFGKYVGAELSRDNGWQMYIPIGFGHGFVTLEADCEVAYKCTNYYAPQHDGGIVWNEPDINIDWQFPAGVTPTLSAKDIALPRLRDFNSRFIYDGHPLEQLVL